jgi:aspartokinase-like uncharacterized kinase
LVERMNVWLARQSHTANVLIVGGGAVADALRRYDRLHGLSDEAAHWLAIGAMRLSAALVAELLHISPPVTRVEDLRLAETGPLQILDVEAFLRTAETSGQPLAHSWQVTSDTIAARVARALGASELVLLKSALLPAGLPRGEWCRAGYVDEHFASASQGLAVRCVNLRETRFPQRVDP